MRLPGAMTRMIFELAYEAIEPSRSRNQASHINFDVVPMWLEVYPVDPGLLDDPYNYLGVEGSLWMKRIAVLFVPRCRRLLTTSLWGCMKKLNFRNIHLSAALLILTLS